MVVQLVYCSYQSPVITLDLLSRTLAFSLHHIFQVHFFFEFSPECCYSSEFVR